MVMLAMEVFFIGRLGDAYKIPKMLQHFQNMDLCCWSIGRKNSIELNVLFYSMIGFIFVRHMEFGL